MMKTSHKKKKIIIIIDRPLAMLHARTLTAAKEQLIVS